MTKTAVVSMSFAILLVALIVIFGSVNLQVGNASMVASSAEAKLSAEDRAAIRDLAGRYSHALDLGEPTVWAEVFTDDGVLEMVSQGYEITGDALRALGAPRDRSVRQSRHIPTTFIIEGEGDAATMRSYVTVIGIAETPNIVFQGRYEDRLRRVAGEWRIARRRVIGDWIDPEVGRRVASPR